MSNHDMRVAISYALSWPNRNNMDLKDLDLHNLKSLTFNKVKNDENLILKDYINIGVAVDTPNGLTVPCIKSVDHKNIFELSEELMDISTRARKKKLKPEELKGSTFTISSLGQSPRNFSFVDIEPSLITTTIVMSTPCDR